MPKKLMPAALGTISNVAAVGTPMMIVFDQLEVLETSRDHILAYGNTLVSLTEPPMGGLLAVQMVIDTEWDRAIKTTFSTGLRARLDVNRMALALPTASQRKALWEGWRERAGTQLPFPAPLSNDGWMRLEHQQGVTPGMMLKQFHFPDENGAEHPPATSLQEQWDAECKAVNQDRNAHEFADESRLRDGLIEALNTAEGAKVNATTDSIEVKATSDACLVLWQSASFQTLNGALKKWATKTKTARVVLVRERDCPLKPTWKSTLQQLQAFCSTPNGAFVEVSREDVVRLLTLARFLGKARARDITGPDGSPCDLETIQDWIVRTLRPYDWPVIKECLEPQTHETTTPETVKPTTKPKPAPKKKSAPTESLALSIVRELRLASVDRVMHDARKKQPDAQPETILTQLECPEIEWFGRSIVAIRRP
jgi:hypothetical protein